MIERDVLMTVAFSTVPLRCLKGHLHFIHVHHRPKGLALITLGNHVQEHLHKNLLLITPTVLKQDLLPVFNEALIRGKANRIPALNTMMY